MPLVDPPHVPTPAELEADSVADHVANDLHGGGATKAAEEHDDSDVKSAAAHVRRVYEMGVTYFDCARSYWDGKSEEAYGLGLSEVRKNIFLTSKSGKRTRKEAEAELETTLRLMKTDHLDIWQMTCATAEA